MRQVLIEYTGVSMSDEKPTWGYRFGTFEANPATGELRRQGLRVRLNAQPFQVLLMLLEQPGEVLGREEIARRLWPEGTFVDFEHGVNSAVNRIREAIGDSAANPRFIETLARRGYRFIAPVERVAANGSAPSQIPAQQELTDEPSRDLRSEAGETPVPETGLAGRILTTPADLPQASPRVVQTLLVLFQLMYLAFYVGALANLAEIEDLLLPLPYAAGVYLVLVVSAGVLIPVRAFILCAVLFRAPRFHQKFLKLWGPLLVADIVWALSPFLLLHHINFGLAMAATALLVYSPFVQRSLVLMATKTPSE